MGIKSKRVGFTFDDHSVRTLEQMTQEGRFSSMADTVRESIQISRALQTQAKKGFTEIVMRNPETQQERVMIVPRLSSMADLPED
jgi:Arc/MetJ-type ribon-helix-helix transcriptional regulator